MMNQIIRSGSSLLPSILDRWVLATPGKVAIVQAEEGRQWMYKQLYKQVLYAANYLLRQGVQPGDRVMGLMGSTLEQTALMWASWKVGAVFIPLDLRDVYLSLESQIRNLKPQVIFVSPSHVKLLKSHKWQEQFQNSIWTLWGDMEEGESVPHDVQVYSPRNRPLFFSIKKFKNKLENIQKGLHLWQPALILPGQGVIVKANPVVLSFDTIQAQAQQFISLFQLNQTGKSLCAGSNLSVNSLIHNLLAPLMAGGTSILTKARKQEEWISLIGRYHIQHLSLPHFARTTPDFRAFYSLSHLLVPQQISGPISVRHSVRLAYSLNLPEAGGMVSIANRNKKQFPIGRISIREAIGPGGRDGLEYPSNTWGELCLHPPFVFSGYFSQNGMIAPCISKEGLLYTGIEACIATDNQNRYLLTEKKEGFGLGPSRLAVA